MIIGNISILLEALSIIMCLHYLYDKRFELDIATICLLSTDLILMQVIDYYELSSFFSLLMYPMIVIYCVVEFGFKLKQLIVNTVLYVIIISCMQFIIMLLLRVFFNELVVKYGEMMIFNGIIFAIVIFILPKCRLNELSKYLQDKENILIVILNLVIGLISFCIIGFKKENRLEIFQYILLFFIIILIELLASKIGKYKLKSIEVETELKMYKLYEDSFHNLIDDIKLKQHEFDNHINVIFNQHYMYKTYDELVNAQKGYCHVLIKENQYNKLLNKGNPIILGFLYGKFIDIEKKGIEVNYHIDIENMMVKIPIYKIVEILGDLINNAVEALENKENGNKIFVEIIEKDDTFILEVRNESLFTNLEKVGKFFEKDYSSKGENRGLGLYNVKKICSEYKLDIVCRNLEIENVNWLSFCIKGKRESFR